MSLKNIYIIALLLFCIVVLQLELVMMVLMEKNNLRLWSAQIELNEATTNYIASACPAS